MRRLLASLSLLLAALGCGSIQPETPLSPTYLPPPFEYLQGPAELRVGTTISGLVPIAIPVVFGGPFSPATGFRVDPPLPRGLSLDPRFGSISGTPQQASDWTTYTITASNEAGSRPGGLSLRTFLPGAPSGLSYRGALSGWLKVPMKPVPPSVSGEAPFTFTVNPPLPEGLSLDPITGSISGTPRALASYTSHRVEVANGLGRTWVSLLAHIGEGQIPTLRYDSSTFAAPVGQAMPLLACSQSTLPLAERFTVEPPLPRGLEIDAVTGKLSGTPQEPAVMRTYEVIATNPLGESRTPLVLSTVPAGHPAIERFTATFHPGTEYTDTHYRFDFTVRNASSLWLNGERVQGSPVRLAWPSASREWLLEARNADGTSFAWLRLPLTP